MKFTTILVMAVALLCAMSGCSSGKSAENEVTESVVSETDSTIVKPFYTSDPVEFDTDDPAIWINETDPSQSLVIGTDKDENGALYVFDLKGKQIITKTVKSLKRPNNVDVAYGLMLNGKKVDIAVTSERMTHNLRIFSLPNMEAIDGGGIPVYEGETGEMFRDLMGVSLYTDKSGKIYVIAGRKSGPTDGTYLWQYLLEDNGKGQVKASLVRKFGQYSGKKEIEAIAVDNELGYIYYSDEQFGIRKYYADPSKGNEELAIFGQGEYLDDNEGISIYQLTDSTGYILVSDQAANQFHVYSREGQSNDHDHVRISTVKTSTNNSDGSEVVSVPLNQDFKHGLFVAMSDDKTFQYYRWEDLAGKTLKIRNKE